MTKVIVVVSGGVVQSVYSDDDSLQVEVLDCDDIRDVEGPESADVKVALVDERYDHIY